MNNLIERLKLFVSSLILMPILFGFWILIGVMFLCVPLWVLISPETLKIKINDNSNNDDEEDDEE